MKLTAILILLALLSAFQLGRLTYLVKSNPIPTQEDKVETERELNNHLNQINPLMKFNFIDSLLYYKGSSAYFYKTLHCEKKGAEVAFEGKKLDGQDFLCAMSDVFHHGTNYTQFLVDSDQVQKIQSVLATLGPSEISHLLMGGPTLFSGQYFFLKKDQNLYAVYPRSQAENFIQQFELKRYTKRLMKDIIFNIAPSLLFLLLLMIGLIKKLLEDKRLQEKKKLTFEFLTHEIRTPLSSLTLNLENAFSQLEASCDKEKLSHMLLLMDSDVSRLNRLVEKSKNILKVNLKNEKLTFIPSLTHFLEDLCEESYPQFKLLKPLKGEDQEVSLPLYWVKLSLTNLMDNALKYGKEPFFLRFEINHHSLKIHVIDHGKFEEKAQSGRGLGIGLEMVKQIMKNLGGDLIIKKNPTTMTLKLKNTQTRRYSLEKWRQLALNR